MSKKDQLKKAEHVKDTVLKLSYADGAEVLVDFKSWFAGNRTPYERRYKNPSWFRRFKLLGDHAIVWGDYLMVFSAAKLRAGKSPGVEVLRSARAA